MDIKHGAPVGIEDKGLSESNDCFTTTGHASVFGNKDLGGDVVLEGAYAQSLREHGYPLILFQHKTDDVPIGVCTEAKETKRGLYIKAELAHDDQFVSSRLIPQLRRRALKGLSVGYRALETEKRPSDGARLLKRIRLYEVSIVSMPMNPQASVETIKHSSPSELAEELDQMQRTLSVLKEELQPDRARQIRDAARAMQSFHDEVKRHFQVRQPELRDPFDALERALRQMDTRIAHLHKATRS